MKLLLNAKKKIWLDDKIFISKWTKLVQQMWKQSCQRKDCNTEAFYLPSHRSDQGANKKYWKKCSKKEKWREFSRRINYWCRENYYKQIKQEKKIKKKLMSDLGVEPGTFYSRSVHNPICMLKQLESLICRKFPKIYKREIPKSNLAGGLYWLIIYWSFKTIE